MTREQLKNLTSINDIEVTKRDNDKYYIYAMDKYGSLEYEGFLSKEKIKKYFGDEIGDLILKAADSDWNHVTFKEFEPIISKYEDKYKLSNEEIIKKAEKTFGTTTNPYLAFYLNTDGKMLKAEGDYQSRYTDHNEIGCIMDYFSGCEAMYEYMKLGNIRLKPEAPGLELIEEPTESQYRIIKKYAQFFTDRDDEFYLEISNKNGYNIAERDYNNNSVNHIIDDIKYFFKNNNFPTRSELSIWHENLLLEDKESVKKYYPNLSEIEFEEILSLDPSYNPNKNSVGTYGKWLLNLSKKDKLTNKGHITDLLNRFEEVKNQLKNKDINTFKSLEDLEDYLNDDDNYKDLSSRQELRKTQKAIHNVDLEKDSEVVFEDKDWIVYVPRTYESSCKLGQDTNWCTATNSNDHYYNYYTEKGPLYININKHNPTEKYQFHFETQSFMDKNDESISLVNFLIENPSLYKFYEDKLDVDLRDEIKEIEDFKKDNPEKIFYYDSERPILDDLRPYIKKIIIKDNVKIIKDYAFSRCYSLTSVTIPKNVTIIGSNAFEYCYNLTNVIFEENSQLKTIGFYAFYYCSNLIDITIPSSVKIIKEYAFYDCHSLKRVNIMDLSAWCNIDFSYFTDNPLIYAKHLYLNNNEIKNLIIPNTITKIKEGAFSFCTSLISVEIPTSVTNIDNNAFCDCSSLTSITIPSSVTKIGSYVFSSCESLIDITIPKSVTSLGDYIFYNCNKLKTIYYNGTEEQWEKLIEYAYVWTPSQTKIIFKENEDLKESGYSGYSMSNNAVDAYNSGEKPLSKWTKDDILNKIRKLKPEFLPYLSKLTLSNLRNMFLYQSSWHHTSSYYNKTDFYSFDEDKLDEITLEEIEDLIKSNKEWNQKQKELPKKEPERPKYITALVGYKEWEGSRNYGHYVYNLEIVNYMDNDKMVKCKLSSTNQKRISSLDIYDQISQLTKFPPKEKLYKKYKEIEEKLKREWGKRLYTQQLNY